MATPPLPNRLTSLHSDSTADEKPPPLPTRDPPSYRPSTSSVTSSLLSSAQPLSSSTPQMQRQLSASHRESITSEDAIQLSPGLTRVQFSSKTNPRYVITSPNRPRTTHDDDDYEELDALDEINPSMALPGRVLSRNHRPDGSMDTDAPPLPPPPLATSSANDSPLGNSRPSTGSLSSEGYTTPPPIPPPRSNQAALSSIYDDNGHGAEDDPGYETIDHAQRSKSEGDGNGGRPALVRNVSEMTDDEIEKLVNTPISLPQNDQPKVAILSNTRQHHQRVPALPSEMRSWKFKAAAEPESDDDNDFVNSTELQEMLLANQLDKNQPSSNGAPTSLEDKEENERRTREQEGWSSRTPSPPPPPPREYTLSIMRKPVRAEEVKLPVATVVGQLSKQTVIPPLHVRHVTGVEGPGMLYSEHDVEGNDVVDGASATCEVQRTTSWLYCDDVDDSGVNNDDNGGGGQETAPSGDKDGAVTNGLDDKPPISTEEIEIQLPAVKEQERATTDSKPGPHELPVNGSTCNHVNGTMQSLKADRSDSTSVDTDAQTCNGATALSVPGTIEEQRQSFASSVISDDVFTDAAATSDERKSKSGGTGEKEGGGRPPEDGSFNEESLRLDSVNASVRSSDNEDGRFPSFTTDIDLSTLTMEESFVRDGTITPVQMTLNESVVNMMRYRVSPTPDRMGGSGTTGGGEEDEENELLESAEYSSLPEDDDEEEMNAGSKTSTRTDVAELHYDALGRPRSKSWITKTMELRKTPVSQRTVVKLDSLACTCILLLYGAAKVLEVCVHTLYQE